VVVSNAISIILLVHGIPRSVEEQQKEAIGILSVAVESSLKRLRRQLGMYILRYAREDKWAKHEPIIY
jgi:hypothetical protein